MRSANTTCRSRLLSRFILPVFCDKSSEILQTALPPSLTQQLSALRATGVSRDKEAVIRVGWERWRRFERRLHPQTQQSFSSLNHLKEHSDCHCHRGLGPDCGFLYFRAGLKERTVDTRVRGIPEHVWFSHVIPLPSSSRWEASHLCGKQDKGLMNHWLSSINN